MANYYCTVRTNYFHVKDEEKFRELMSRVYGSEDGVDLWEGTDKLGKTIFGFGVYGGISGVRNAGDDDCEDIAALMRRYINKYDMSWECARDEAIRDYLRDKAGPMDES